MPLGVLNARLRSLMICVLLKEVKGIDSFINGISIHSETLEDPLFSLMCVFDRMLLGKLN